MLYTRFFSICFRLCH